MDLLVSSLAMWQNCDRVPGAAFAPSEVPIFVGCFMVLGLGLEFSLLVPGCFS